MEEATVDENESKRETPRREGTTKRKVGQKKKTDERGGKEKNEQEKERRGGGGRRRWNPVGWNAFGARKRQRRTAPTKNEGRHADEPDESDNNNNNISNNIETIPKCDSVATSKPNRLPTEKKTFKNGVDRKTLFDEIRCGSFYFGDNQRGSSSSDRFRFDGNVDME